MSNKLPVVRPDRLLRVLLRLGFAETRVKGSHHFLRHPDGRVTTVSTHGGSKEVPTGTLAAILSDVRITADELRNLL